MKKEYTKFEEATNHNIAALEEFGKGEEGIDFVEKTQEEKLNDPTRPNEKMLLR